jgi:rfaE bifunctional protein kinase chain/domain
MPDLIRTIETVFPQKTVIVVGDLVADQFLSGTISRVSREAPVFIMRHEETVTLPGAAANAAANAAALGGRACVIGIVGTDGNGNKLMSALADADVDTEGVIADEKIATTTKVRVLAGREFAAKNQVIRIDYEAGKELPPHFEQAVCERLAKAASKADVIIVSDYDYGTVTATVFADAARLANERGIPLVVDSRFRLEKFAGATSATPNREEVEQILGPSFAASDCGSLRERLGFEALIVTNGNRGMSIYQKGVEAREIAAVGGTTAVDVTGAGDTVIAAYGLGLASGLNHAAAANIANHAGGIVVMKKRTAIATPSELVDSIRRNGSETAVQQAP